MAKTFRALVVREENENQFTRAVEERSTADLPQGSLLIRVQYSSLNYKDALSASGNKGVTRHYPHTPGIDAAGVVEESDTPQFAPGDAVIVTGRDLGMNTDGGFGQYIRVPADWAVSLPQGLTLRESMIYGTAGFTAALSVLRLLRYGLSPEQGEVLVTGASGGVGSTAVALLAKLGFTVAAASGKPSAQEFLRKLGAAQVLSREEAADSSRALLKPRWAGAVDTVGGEYLSAALKATRYGGGVTTCGNVASGELHSTVYPFILRGVALLGIDSVECPLPVRQQIWQHLAGDWKLADLEGLSRQVGLDALDVEIERILQGQQTGRVLVSLP